MRHTCSFQISSLPNISSFHRKLPSSDCSTNNKKKKPGYSIDYTVTAKLGKKFKASSSFDVDAVPIPSKIINRWYRPREFPVKKDANLFGGVSVDGRVVMGAMLNSCVVGRGENIELFLACRNDSTTPIRCVRIEIIEYRQCSFGQDPRKQGKYDVLKAVQSLSLPSSCNAQDKESVGKNSKDVLCKQVYKELKRRRDPILVTIPKDSRDTYKGSLIHIWHCVKITYELKCRQRSNDVVAFMPIKIGRVPDAFHVPMPAPSVFDIESVGDNSSVNSYRTINSAALTTCSIPLSTVAPLRWDDSSDVSSSKSNSPETNYKLPIPLTKQVSMGSVSTRSFSPSVNSTIFEESEFVAHDEGPMSIACLRNLASPSSIGNRSRSSFRRNKPPPRYVSSSVPVEV